MFKKIFSKQSIYFIYLNYIYYYLFVKYYYDKLLWVQQSSPIVSFNDAEVSFSASPSNFDAIF